MWNKIYPIFLAVFVLVMLVLTYLAYSQLQSIGFAPEVIRDNYQTYENYFRQFLWMSSVVLLILANVLLWTERKSWALWTTLLYFALFTLLEGWWLGRAYTAYLQQHNLPQSAISFGILISTIMCIVAAVGIFFDHFLVLRMRERIYKTDSAEISDDIVAIEEKPPAEET